jgi:hypothetical protein
MSAAALRASGPASAALRCRHRLVQRVGILGALGALGACSAQVLYATGQAWQKQECHKLPYGDERMRCQTSTASSYERYRAEAEAAQKPRP